MHDTTFDTSRARECVCGCVRVCVRERETERETEGETERETERERERERHVERVERVPNGLPPLPPPHHALRTLSVAF